MRLGKILQILICMCRFPSSTQFSKISTASLRDLSDGGERESREKRELWRREREKDVDLFFFGLEIGMEGNK